MVDDVRRRSHCAKLDMGASLGDASHSLGRPRPLSRHQHIHVMASPRPEGRGDQGPYFWPDVDDSE